MSRAHSTFIPGEQLGTVTDWSFGAVDQASLRFQAKLKAQAEAELRSKDEAVRHSLPRVRLAELPRPWSGAQPRPVP